MGYSNPSSAVFVVTASITLGTLLLFPLSLMMMLAGLLFRAAAGIFRGMGRWIDCLLRRVLDWPHFCQALDRKKNSAQAIFMSIDRAIYRKGFLVVLLTRLVMLIPYPALNYSLGLTNVSFREYLLATSLGAIPPFFLFVYLGTTVNDIAAIINGDVSLDGNEMVIGTIALVAVDQSRITDCPNCRQNP